MGDDAVLILVGVDGRDVTQFQAFRALRAWSWLMPTRSGTSTWSEPEDRYAVIVWPALTLEPGEGLVWATLPSATVSEATLLELTSHFRPKASTA